MTRTRLASTHNLFINGLVVSGSRVVLDFATPRFEVMVFWSFVSGGGQFREREREREREVLG